MPRFCANLAYLFTEVPFLDRFERAARAGFRGVEFPIPYAHDAAELAACARSAGVEVVLINLPAGDWERGDRGIGCLPSRVSEFRDGVPRAIEYARALACTRVNCLAGIAPARVPEATLRETYVSNLRFAAGELDRAGITVLVEPISTRAIPGFFLRYSAQALALIDDARAANARLQYDVYHMQIMEGDLSATIEAHLRRIGHVQIADVPGRHEPGTGEIRFPFLFEGLDRLGYDGWVGCEYIPREDTEAGLDWLRPWLERSSRSLRASEGAAPAATGPAAGAAGAAPAAPQQRESEA